MTTFFNYNLNRQSSQKWNQKNIETKINQNFNYEDIKRHILL